MMRHKTRQVVDVSVGVVTHYSVAQPDDIFHTVIITEIAFYLVLVQVGVAVLVE